MCGGEVKQAANEEGRPAVPIETLEHEASWNNKLEKFFGGTWSDKVQQGRYPIFGVALIWLAIAIWRTAKMEPLSEEE